MTLRECYLTLDLQPGASLEAIKSAYRRLAGTWHPDRHPDNPDRRATAEERFKAINAAYTRLCSASERERAALRRSPRARRARDRRPSGCSSETSSGERAYDRSALARRGGVYRDQAPASFRQKRRRSPASGATGNQARSVDLPFEGGASIRRPGWASNGMPNRTTPTGAWLQGWSGVALVAGGVGAFCLGLLRSTSLAEMLAWAATWAVIAVGTFTLVSKGGNKPSPDA